MSYKELRDKKVQIENAKITWMLIIISLTFIFLTLPHTVLYFLWTIPKLTKYNSSSRLFFNISPNVMKLTELLYVMNHSINFLLYIITRNSFRKILKEQMALDCFKNTIFHPSKNIKQRKAASNSLISIQRTKIEENSKPVLNNKTAKLKEENLVSTKSTNSKIKSTTIPTQSEVFDYESYWEMKPLNDINENLNNSKSINSNENSNKNFKSYLNLKFFKN
jgi:hypothetical protein